MKANRLFKEFIENEKATGFILIFCTLSSLLFSNILFGSSYIDLWHTKIGNHQSVEHLVNEGLMAIFFLLIGLELKREIYIGELSNVKNAILPVAGAVGGMVVPAYIYLFLNNGTSTQSGFGIPMATDIAFAIGILSLLGKRVPTSLKVFLTALAVIDDLGAIIIIALFYSSALVWINLIAALIVFGILIIFNRFKVNNLILYLLGGIIMWYFMLKSGIHPTIAGVLLAFAIPFQNGKKNSISYQLQHSLYKPVSFIILPLFALANTAIIIDFGWQHIYSQNYTLGILIGLIIGKPIGILLFTWLLVKLDLCQLPKDLNWKKMIGVSLLGGIGFTMSIFITLLAFDNLSIIDNSKFIILVASSIAATLGLIWLRQVLVISKED